MTTVIHTKDVCIMNLHAYVMMILSVPLNHVIPLTDVSTLTLIVMIAILLPMIIVILHLDVSTSNTRINLMMMILQDMEINFNK